MCPGRADQGEEYQIPRTRVLNPLCGIRRYVDDIAFADVFCTVIDMHSPVSREYVIDFRLLQFVAVGMMCGRYPGMGDGIGQVDRLVRRMQYLAYAAAIVGGEFRTRTDIFYKHERLRYNVPMPKYTGNPDYQHDSIPRIGILMTNLGTPDAPTAAALRKYLAEFLADPRVIEVPKILWWPILHGIILRTRPRRSAQAYEKVWSSEGSPLLAITRRQGEAVQRLLADRHGDSVKVVIAMRYGEPSIRQGLQELRSANARRILVLPLYPQYAAATTASTFDAVSAVLKTWRWLPGLRMIDHYHDDPGYISALAAAIERHQATHGRPDRLIFSFHGIPRHYFDAGDPYHCECQKTARLVAEKMQLGDNDWQLTFQSRFGPREWLQPYTDVTLKGLPAQGIRHVQVICPGFAADCLETLEEINMQNREFFISAGGESFSYIPALNDDELHIQALADLITLHLCGWINKDDQRPPGSLAQSGATSRQRALSMGAKN